jgi:hypothetical protein
MQRAVFDDFTIEVSDQQLRKMILDQLSGKKPAAPVALEGKLSLPRIGEYWPGQGGKFAGLMRGRDGGPDYALIKGPELGEMNFKGAQEKAAAVEVDGHKDFRCPYRNEQSLLFANLKDEFEKRWYWSCERHPDDEDYAFAQSFSYGIQYYCYVDFKCLACAVRIVPIQ